MDNYTVTFIYDGDFDIPNDKDALDNKLPKMVLEKMESHQFELVDFNLTRHYDDDHSETYINDPYLHRSVLEIKIDLAMKDLQSREAIYEKCLESLQHGQPALCRAYENENEKLGMLQSIICFEMKHKAA